MRRLASAMIAAALLPLFAAVAHGQGAEEEAPAPAEEGTMMPGCKEMMASMRARDEELAQLIARMKAAQGDNKVDAIAAVVEALVAERQHMHEHMGMMSEMKCGEMMKRD